MTFFENTPLFFLKIFEEPMKECCWNMLHCVDGSYRNHFRSTWERRKYIP